MKLTLIQEGLVGCITATRDGLSTGTLELIACDPERRTISGVKRLTTTRLRSELHRLEKAGVVTHRDGKWVAQ